MNSLAAIFIHTSPSAVVDQLLESLPAEYRQYGISSPADRYAVAHLAAADALLRHAHSAESDEALVAHLVREAQQHYTQGSFLASAHSTQGSPAAPAAQYEPNELSPLAICCEVGLAALSWMKEDAAAAVAQLASALARAEHLARQRPAALESVKEAERVEINPTGSSTVSGPRPSLTWSWKFNGSRPVIGTAARLAQDIDFALQTAQRLNPDPAEIFGTTYYMVDAQPR